MIVHNQDIKTISRQIDVFILESINLENQEAQDLSLFQHQTHHFAYTIDEYLETSFADGSRYLIDLYRYWDNEILRRLYRKKDIESNKRRLEAYRNNLQYLKELLKTVTLELDQKSFQTVQGKLDFILTKLNILFNQGAFSISHILNLNNINYRDGEPREIHDLLVKKGYALSYSKDKGDIIEISLKGAAYIERKNKITSKKVAVKSQEDLNSKVDLIIERLKTLGYGQEIIFEELEELKELNIKLSKKNWKQVLKGKLFDLGLQQVVKKETLNLIYETLTDDQLKLPTL